MRNRSSSSDSHVSIITIDHFFFYWKYSYLVDYWALEDRTRTITQHAKYFSYLIISWCGNSLDNNCFWENKLYVDWWDVKVHMCFSFIFCALMICQSDCQSDLSPVSADKLCPKSVGCLGNYHKRLSQCKIVKINQVYPLTFIFSKAYAIPVRKTYPENKRVLMFHQ